MKAEFDPCNKYAKYSDTFILDACGLIPSFLIAGQDNEMTAVDAINKFYEHGGGWTPLNGFIISECSVEYPNDLPMHPYMKIYYSDDETVWIYPYGFTRINNAIGRLD